MDLRNTAQLLRSRFSLDEIRKGLPLPMTYMHYRFIIYASLLPFSLPRISLHWNNTACSLMRNNDRSISFGSYDYFA